jgi:hypothetical protein
MLITIKPKTDTLTGLVEILDSFIFDGYKICIHIPYGYNKEEYDNNNLYTASEYSTGIRLIGNSESNCSTVEKTKKTAERILKKRKNVFLERIKTYPIINKKK